MQLRDSISYLINRLVAVVAMALVPTTLGQTSVTLLDQACVERAADITLADIAAIEGDKLDALTPLSVLEPEQITARTGQGPSQWLSVTPSDVRAAIRAAGIPTGDISVSGSTCYIRIGQHVSTQVRSSGHQPVQQPMVTVADLEPGTVAHSVGRRLATLYDATPSSIRVRLESRSDTLLAMNTAGKVVDIQLSATGQASRATMRVTAYSQGRILEAEGVYADVQLKREVVRATRVLRREEMLTPETVSIVTEWVEPAIGQTITSDAIGSYQVRKTVQAGAIITDRDIEEPLLIERGRSVTVHSLRGSMVLRLGGTAKADAAQDEIIEVRLDDTHKVIRARAVSPGNVILVPASALAETADRSATAPSTENTP